VATAQPKDWQKGLLPPQPPRVSCAPGGRTTQGLAAAYTHEAMQTALCSTQPPWLAMAAATMPREKELRSRRRPVGRAAATHRVQRRPDRPPPSRSVRRHPGTQMRRPRAGARRCTRALPVRRDRMWSLPIIPAAAIIYESIHSGALNGRVDSWSACWSGGLIDAYYDNSIHHAGTQC
jgi:hypothetical protein